MEPLDDICAEGKVTTCGSRVSDASSDEEFGRTNIERKDEDDSKDIETRKDDGREKSKKREMKRDKTHEEKVKKRWVRFPSVRERRKAKEEGRIHAFGVRGIKRSWVCLRNFLTVWCV